MPPLPPPRKSRIGLQELGQDIPPRDQQTPEVLAAFQKDEIEKWWPIIAAAGGSLSDIETTMAMTAKDASARSNLPERPRRISAVPAARNSMREV